MSGIFCLNTFLTGAPFEKLPEMHDLLGSFVDNALEFEFEGDLRSLAPTIAVASVLSNKAIGAPKEALRFSGVYLQQRAVHCRLENLLKGRTPGPEFSFYYFADARLPKASPNPIHRILFEAKPGRRYIFFLSQEGQVLRSIGDVGDFTIPVFSGAHPGAADLNGNPDPAQLAGRIADILLVSGTGFDAREFARNIVYARLAADRVGSREYTAHLLRDLLSQTEPLRSAACYELVHSFYGQYQCLTNLSNDVSLDSGARERASRALEDEKRKELRLKEQLREPATLGFGKMLRPDSRIANLEELKIMLSAPDPEIHRLVCRAIQRYFPRTPVKACN
ncbi:MAG: hypothetical protein ABI822_33205 [Bryobacteraceae bacterium]